MLAGCQVQKLHLLLSQWEQQQFFRFIPSWLWLLKLNWPEKQWKAAYPTLCLDFYMHIYYTSPGHQIQFGWCLLANIGFLRSVLDYIIICTNCMVGILTLPFIQLSGIAKMFSNEVTLASAWIHLLAIDLFAARSIFRRLYLCWAMPLCFLFGTTWGGCHC